MSTSLQKHNSGYRRSLVLAIALLVLVSHARAQDDGTRPDEKSGTSSATQTPPATSKAAGQTADDKAKAKSKRTRRPPSDPHRPWGQGVRDNAYMGRVLAPVMSYLGADWLIRPEREEEEEPERMLDALQIKPGMVVADVGAGVGYTSVRIAKRVGTEGKVLATDIQPQMIRMLRQNIKELKLDRVIQPIQCTADDPKLPEGEVDLVIMVDVYHECTHPVETLQGIRRALKPGGRLVLVEFRAEDPEVPILPEHKMTAMQAQNEVEPQGFKLATRHEFLPWQHVLVFEKTADDPGNAQGKSPSGQATKDAEKNGTKEAAERSKTERDQESK